MQAQAGALLVLAAKCRARRHHCRQAALPAPARAAAASPASSAPAPPPRLQPPNSRCRRPPPRLLWLRRAPQAESWLLPGLIQEATLYRPAWEKETMGSFEWWWWCVYEGSWVLALGYEGHTIRLNWGIFKFWTWKFRVRCQKRGRHVLQVCIISSHFHISMWDQH